MDISNIRNICIFDTVNIPWYEVHGTICCYHDKNNILVAVNIKELTTYRNSFHSLGHLMVGRPLISITKAKEIREYFPTEEYVFKWVGTDDIEYRDAELEDLIRKLKYELQTEYGV